MKALQVIRSAFRCNVEEQDDPAVWMSRALVSAGATLGVLLRDNAVNYAVEGLDGSGLSFGGKSLSHSAHPDHDVAALLGGGIPVYVVAEDAEARGIDIAALIPGTRPVRRAALPGLFAEFDRIWHW